MDNENVDVGTEGPPTSLGTVSRSRSWHRRVMQRLGMPLLLLALCSGHPAHAGNTAQPTTVAPDVTQPPKKSDESRMLMTVGERSFTITLADNEAARTFATMLPLKLDMEELNGNEKKKELPDALPRNESQPGTIRNGDLMLWGSRTVVIFYQTFTSNYSYTRLGRVDDATGLAQALGRGDVQVAFSRDLH